MVSSAIIGKSGSKTLHDKKIEERHGLFSDYVIDETYSLPRSWGSGY